jgi:hypothetical protein
MIEKCTLFSADNKMKTLARTYHHSAAHNNDKLRNTQFSNNI